MIIKYILVDEVVNGIPHNYKYGISDMTYQEYLSDINHCENYEILDDSICDLCDEKGDELAFKDYDVIFADGKASFKIRGSVDFL